MAGPVTLAMQSRHAAFTDAVGGDQIPQSPDKSQTLEKTPPTQEKKSKRVRTGCLTCRDRHLKCDEGLPICQNCLKSNRDCRRGLRISFMDTNVKKPPVILPPTADWTVSFQDESREIASEYKGGIEKYGPVNRTRNPEPFGYPESYNYNHRPSFPDIGSDFSGASAYGSLKAVPLPNQQSHFQDQSSSHNMSAQAPVNAFMTPQSQLQYAQAAEEQEQSEPERPDYLVDQEEVLFMQVFVEEVGIWMDSMDSRKHFSRQLPFHALKEPMLLNAFLACGARHLALVNPRYSDDKALRYYDLATKHLLDALQDPNRDTVLCATTAVILNVYEIMCEKALQRMNHIAGARALIKECDWSARSNGIGAACFWLNVGMELLSCLHFNWQVAWDPDEWGVDMNMISELESSREELWTHRIVYIVAKVCNFRAAISHNTNNQHYDQQQRYQEWLHLKTLADTWNKCIPRTMHPVAFLWPGQTLSGSAFPEVWVIKRASIVARLFYHTCMCLLAQINPVAGSQEPDMRSMLEEHSQMICGISAHVKDRGVASVALRSLAIAAECLKERRAQEEVLQIIDKIRQETGWRVGFLNKELQEKWGWNMNEQPAVPPPQQQQLPPPPQPQPRAAMRPIFNPLVGISFENPQHPYQEVYVAPNVNQLIQQAQQAQQEQPQSQQPHNGYNFYQTLQ